jgi:hypothetical protein
VALRGLLVPLHLLPALLCSVKGKETWLLVQQLLLRVLLLQMQAWALGVAAQLWKTFVAGRMALLVTALLAWA